MKCKNKIVKSYKIGNFIKLYSKSKNCQKIVENAILKTGGGSKKNNSLYIKIIDINLIKKSIDFFNAFMLIQ